MRPTDIDGLSVTNRASKLSVLCIYATLCCMAIETLRTHFCVISAMVPNRSHVGRSTRTTCWRVHDLWCGIFGAHSGDSSACSTETVLFQMISWEEAEGNKPLIETRRDQHTYTGVENDDVCGSRHSPGSHIIDGSIVCAWALTGTEGDTKYAHLQSKRGPHYGGTERSRGSCCTRLWLQPQRSVPPPNSNSVHAASTLPEMLAHASSCPLTEIGGPKTKQLPPPRLVSGHPFNRLSKETQRRTSAAATSFPG